MFTPRIRRLATTGLLCGALTVASLGPVFAAPFGDDTATPTPVAAATTPGAGLQALRSHRHETPMDHLLRGIMHPVAQLFGITTAQLGEQLKQGQTLAQIAAQYGKTATDVENTLMDTLKKRLDALVAAGKISSDKETQILNNASTKFSKLVNADLSKVVQRVELKRARQLHRQANATPTATATSQ